MRRALTGTLAAVLLLTACDRVQNPTEAASVPTQGVEATPEPTARQTRGSVLTARLLDAARDGDLARVGRLIADGADVNATDERGESAFLVAASEGDLPLLDLTLQHGADVAVLDRFDGTALIRAAERGHATVVGRLLQTEVDVDHVNRLGWTALHEAVILGDGSSRYVETVRLLVAGGADVDLPSRRDGMRPLEHAKGRQMKAVAAALWAADRARGLDRRRARALLLDAARAGEPDRVAVALRAGAPVDGRDGRRRTALFLAAQRKHVDVVRLLVDLGADPTIADRDGATAMQQPGCLAHCRA